MSPPLPLSSLQTLCIGLVFLAALYDIATRTLPNKLVLLVALTGVTIHALDGLLLASLAAGSAVFLIAAWCWHRGWLGGGDVKLLGAATLCLPPNDTFTFAAAVAIAGGILALLYLAARTFLHAPVSPRPSSLLARAARVERWRLSRGGPLPYACAIAAGLFFVIV